MDGELSYAVVEIVRDMTLQRHRATTTKGRALDRPEGGRRLPKSASERPSPIPYLVRAVVNIHMLESDAEQVQSRSPSVMHPALFALRVEDR